MTKTTTKRAPARTQKTDAMPATATRRSPKSKVAAEGADQPEIAPVRGPTKLETLIELLSRPEGATISDMMAATSWQAHSVRGAIAGALKKQRSLNVLSEATEQGRTYRIGVESIG